MTINIHDYRGKQHIYNSFRQTSAHPKHLYNDSRKYRYHKEHKTEAATQLKIAAGSIVGTLIPMIFLAKRQSPKKQLSSIKDLFKIDYGVKEMISISAGSIAGGVGTGLIVDKNADKKRKLNEGVFQFLNASVPPIFVGGLLKITEKTKHLNNIPGKIAATAIGLLGGIPVATTLANKINDPKNLEPDRKVTLKDSIANIDDALGIFAMAKFPVVDKIPFEKILPAVYALCGFRAGQSN